MGVTLDDLQTFYAQKQAERDAAKAAPEPTTNLEYAQAEIAAIGVHDAITALLAHLVAAVAELADSKSGKSSSAAKADAAKADPGTDDNGAAAGKDSGKK